MRFRRVFIATNVVLLFASLCALYDATAEMSDGAGFRMFVLKTHGVITIDEQEAQRFFGSSLHTNIGRWIAAHHIAAEATFGAVVLAIAILNLAVAIKNRPLPRANAE